MFPNKSARQISLAFRIVEVEWRALVLVTPITSDQRFLRRTDTESRIVLSATVLFFHSPQRNTEASPSNRSENFTVLRRLLSRLVLFLPASRTLLFRSFVFCPVEATGRLTRPNLIKSSWIYIGIAVEMAF